MADTKTQPAANTTSVDFSKMISEGISKGFMAAMQNKAKADADTADHVSMLAQHATVTAEKSASVSSDNKDVVNELNGINLKTVTLAETVQNASDMFAAIPDKLNMIADSVGLMRSGLEGMADSAYGGKNNKDLASSIINALGPNPVGNSMTAHAGVRAAFSRMGEGAGFAPQTAGFAKNVLPDNGKANLAKKAISAASTNTVENDRKIQLEEEDRAYKDSVKPVMPKLQQALDKYLNSDNEAAAATNENGGTGLMGLLALLGGAAFGFITGYIQKLASMWKNVGKTIGEVFKTGWNKFKASKVGQFFSNLGTKIKNAFSGGLKKIGEFGSKLKSMVKFSELKSSFSKMLSGWKNSIKESSIGKAAKGIFDGVKKAGGFLGKLAKKVGGVAKSVGKTALNAAKTAGKTVLNAAKTAGTKALNAAKTAGKFIANTKVGKMAIRGARAGAKFAKRLPMIQAAGTLLDTGVNIYKAAKSGASMKDLLRIGGAGLVDTVSDVFMVPELLNAAKGAIDAGVKGKGLGGILKGAGAGLFKMRDANEISLGNALVAKTMNAVGLGDEGTRAIARASDLDQGWKEAGFETVSGAAAGFGHSAAVYKPKAAGANVDNKTPNATIAEAPTAKPTSEADKNKQLADMLEESVKKAYLSQEVQDANRQNAKETGSAINTQLMG